MVRAIAELLGDENGAMAVEYAILAAFIATAVVVIATDLGDVLVEALERIAAYFPDFPT